MTQGKLWINSFRQPGVKIVHGPMVVGALSSARGGGWGPMGGASTKGGCWGERERIGEVRDWEEERRRDGGGDARRCFRAPSKVGRGSCVGRQQGAWLVGECMVADASRRLARGECLRGWLSGQ